MTWLRGRDRRRVRRLEERLSEAGVPAGLYFLFVVRALYRQSVRDWNREMVDANHSLATVG